MLDSLPAGRGAAFLRRLLRVFSTGRLLLVLTLIVAGYFFVSAADSFIASSRISEEEAQLRQQIAALESRQERLLQIRDYLRMDEYVEFMAQRVFGLARPGETLVIVDAPAAEAAADEGRGLTWWEQLFGP